MSDHATDHGDHGAITPTDHGDHDSREHAGRAITPPITAIHAPIPIRGVYLVPRDRWGLGTNRAVAQGLLRKAQTKQIGDHGQHVTNARKNPARVDEEVATALGVGAVVARPCSDQPLRGPSHRMVTGVRRG